MGILEPKPPTGGILLSQELACLSVPAELRHWLEVTVRSVASCNTRLWISKSSNMGVWPIVVPTVENLRGNFTGLTQKVMQKLKYFPNCKIGDEEDNQEELTNKKIAIKIVVWSEWKQGLRGWRFVYRSWSPTLWIQILN